MSKPKTFLMNGQPAHYSTGAVIIDNRQQILLIDRATPPFGLAGPAGHVDEGEQPLQTVIREVREEIGLDLVLPKLVAEEFIDWNWCGSGIVGHYWYVYRGIIKGEPIIQPDEVKSARWYPIDGLSKRKLEPVWEYWLKKLEIS